MENAPSTKLTDIQKEGNLPLISVCFCTYKRPRLLKLLLHALAEQKTNDMFKCRVIIVDNDPEKSAKDTFNTFSQPKGIEFSYYSQPKPGLTYARNMSISKASGEYIAILDDDEQPARDWLLQLFTCINRYEADAVFGSVVPQFEGNPPEWITNRKYFFWRDVKDKTGIETNKGATNNLLMRRNLIEQYDLAFDHDYAKIGCEDIAFFINLKNKKPGAKFVTCKEAIVYDTVIKSRCNTDYIKKRLLLEGHGRLLTLKKMETGYFRRKIVYYGQIAKSFLRIISLNLLRPVVYIFHADLSKELYLRSYYHIGIILAFVNYSPYQSRKSMGLDE